MSRRRSSFERAYADGILGNIEQHLHTNASATHTHSLPDTLSQSVMESGSTYVSNSLQLRKQQALVDILIRSCRSNKRICAPHLLEQYTTIVPRTTAFLQRPHRKWSVLTKHKMSLAESLYYALVHCSPDEYHGVLFPYQVEIPDDDADHANMVYLYFDRSQPTVRAHCYLLEPNGVSFTKTYPDGLGNLTRAWHYLCCHAQDVLGVALVRRVRVVGEGIDSKNGLQTYLGSHTKRTKRSGQRLHTVMMRSGYGICGAVTFWLFHMWLKSNKVCTLEKYYGLLLRYTINHRVESQHKIINFIHNINRRVKDKYAILTKKYIDDDLVVIRKHLQKKYGQLLASCGCTITLTFTIKLGNAQKWLLVMRRKVCVGECV